MKTNRKKAFTLVELLVVISIIALLLAILMPALSKVRQRAQTVVCASNLKNYGPALYMYAQENGDKAPFSFSWLYTMATIFKPSPKIRSIIPQACRWHVDTDEPDGTLWPYLKSINVHMCPTFRMMAKAEKVCYNKGDAVAPSLIPGTPPDRGHDQRLPFNPVYSYSMNRWIGLDWKGFEADSTLRYEPSLKLNMIKRSAQCFAFSEENYWVIPDSSIGSKERKEDNGRQYSGMPIGKNDLWLQADIDRPNLALSNFATYHNSPGNRNEGSANAVYVDGHVSLRKGLPGVDAYLEYGRPWDGHEKQNIW